MEHDVLLRFASFQQLWLALHFTFFLNLYSTFLPLSILTMWVIKSCINIVLLPTDVAKFAALSFGALVGLALSLLSLWKIVRRCQSPMPKIVFPEGWVLCFPVSLCWPSLYSNDSSTVGLRYQTLLSFASSPKPGKGWKCSLADFSNNWNHGRTTQNPPKCQWI